MQEILGDFLKRVAKGVGVWGACYPILLRTLNVKDG